jgi:hypothetical protein
MNNWVVVLRRGEYDSITKAGILFDKYGKTTQQKIIS